MKREGEGEKGTKRKEQLVSGTRLQYDSVRLLLRDERGCTSLGSLKNDECRRSPKVPSFSFNPPLAFHLDRPTRLELAAPLTVPSSSPSTLVQRSPAPSSPSKSLISSTPSRLPLRSPDACTRLQGE